MAGDAAIRRSRRRGRRTAHAAVGLALLAVAIPTGPGWPVEGADDPSTGVLGRVFPNADSFGPRDGVPPAAPAYEGDRISGYVFHTHDVVQSVGLSGKTLNIAVGMDLSGRITGAEIVEHHEPILAIGVSSADLAAFVDEFAGTDVADPVQVRRRPGRRDGTVAAVSGATVSSLLIADAIYQAATAVGQSRGILQPEVSGIDLAGFEEAEWPTLVADGSLQRMKVTVSVMQRELESRGGRLYPEGAGPDDPDALFIELFAGLATPARIGRNLFGASFFNRLVGSLEEGSHLIFVAGNGLYSFKGTQYVRTGQFDRIELVQGSHTYRFAREDYIRPERLRIGEAPDFRELALFVMRPHSGFDPARPWRLRLMVEGDSAEGPVYAVQELDYALPERYLPAAQVTPIPPPSAELWKNVWLERLPDVIFLSTLILVLATLFFLQDPFVRRQKLYRVVRYVFLSVTLLWLGWYAAAQLSVLNVLTFAGALRTEFRWDFFLLEPLIFILWAYVAVALLFSGRGAFCGWLCPFGALQELTNRIGRRFRIPQIRVPFALHERLWPIKYIVFLSLFAVSLGSIDLAQTGSEVEPFKTAIVLHFLRAWPFVAYAAGLLVLGLFIERAFCRYLCPLGAALAIPARIRMFDWLKRHWQCGRQCHICEHHCPVQAIHPTGNINPNECIYCMNCQTLYYDDTVCPPMIERRKRREARQAAGPRQQPTTGA